MLEPGNHDIADQARPVPPPAEPATTELSLPRVLCVLSSMIEKLVARNDKLINMDDDDDGGGGVIIRSLGINSSLKSFHGVRAPSISIPKYLERIYKYTSCSPSCFVVAYVYIDRLIHRHPHSLLVSLNVHRLLVTSVMVASKMLDDVHYNNAFYARVGGVSNGELNKLEIELLFLLDFGVMVSSRVFESYCLHLEKEMLLNGTVGTKIERPLVPEAVVVVDNDHETEISVEDNLLGYSPPQIMD